MNMWIVKNWDISSYVAFILLLVGGINLGLVGIFGGDLIRLILGAFLSRLLYLAIGIAAGYLIYLIVMEQKKAKL